jgi:hypothetical protein
LGRHDRGDLGAHAAAAQWQARCMNTSSDMALLSSLGTQIEELGARVTVIAERYGQTPDSAVATELFAAERALNTARRSVERASALLDQMR